MTDPTEIIETLEPGSPATVATGREPADPTAAPLLVMFGEQDLVCVDETCLPRDVAG